MALHVALKDWRHDLVEGRRRARMVSVALAAAFILAITGVEISSIGVPRLKQMDTAISGMLFVVIFGICARFFGFRQSSAPQSASQVFRSETPENLEAEAGTQGAMILDDLRRLMEQEKAYRQDGITIGDLADKLNVREYLLRRLINGHLGYRNFNSFLNHYRIEEVARQLVAPETRHLPVLSIALDMGYRSLSPFNKAFKEIKGMTPTEYRVHRISEKAGPEER